MKMFNVSWEDDTGETVEQRRQRKENIDRSPLQDSIKSSLNSVNSIESSKAEDAMPASFFSVPKKLSGPQRALSLLKSGSSKILPTRKKHSLFSAQSGPGLQQSIAETSEQTVNHADNRLRMSTVDTMQSAPNSYGMTSSEALISYGMTSTDALISYGTANVRPISMIRNSIMGNPLGIYEVQPLAENSFVTRSTEAKTSFPDVTASLNAFQISPNSASDEEFHIRRDSHVFQFPRLPSRSSAKQARNSIGPVSNELATNSRSIRAAPDVWKPPKDWQCASSSLGKLPVPGELENAKAYLQDRESLPVSSDDPKSTQLLRHIHRMIAATPKIMLERIMEEWTEIKDETMQAEVDFERRLWMLAALKYLRKASATVDETVNQKGGNMMALGQSGLPKILSLYEDKASASFLAAFASTGTEVHQIATEPLQPSLVPMICPLTVPGPHESLPYATQIFHRISCQKLPSIMASHSILPLLRECNRLLLSNGILCLTVLDPSPVPATLGPRLRTWLEMHLLLNLEKNFRCINPARLMPLWLQEAGFNVKDGSSEVNLITFWATRHGKGDLAELTAEMGRLLWKEIWGDFVDGETWWWEDDTVMEECAMLETRWECALVEAEKSR